MGKGLKWVFKFSKIEMEIQMNGQVLTVLSITKHENLLLFGSLFFRPSFLCAYIFIYSNGWSSNILRKTSNTKWMLSIQCVWFFGCVSFFEMNNSFQSEALLIRNSMARSSPLIFSATEKSRSFAYLCQYVSENNEPSLICNLIEFGVDLN